MVDETQIKTEEKSFLDEVKTEREQLEKVREEVRKEREQLEKTKAVEILSGRTLAGNVPEKPAVLTPAEYAKAVMSGKI